MLAMDASVRYGDGWTIYITYIGPYMSCTASEMLILLKGHTDSPIQCVCLDSTFTFLQCVILSNIADALVYLTEGMIICPITYYDSMSMQYDFNEAFLWQKRLQILPNILE